MVILFHKPYGVLSQFTSSKGHTTLASFGPFPPDVYPAGRLDLDSEGLLLLTDDARIKHRLTDPAFAHPRSYWVQVERIPDQRALDQLHHGVVIDGVRTRPAIASFLDEEPPVVERDPPIRFRKNVSSAWISLTLTEGRNRQVRRMTAAVGHPTLRLIRYAIGTLTIDGLRAGDSRSLEYGEWKTLLADVGISAPERSNGGTKKNPGAPTRHRG